MDANKMSRRKFVAAGAVTLSGLMMEIPSFGNQINNELIRLGIIGTGARGQGLASIIKNISGMEVVACCDIIPAHLDEGMKLAAKGAKAYTDYRKLLDDQSIHAVIIATPLYLHHPMSLDAMAAGKHIYLEKSLALDIPLSIDLVKRARPYKKVFQVGYQYRSHALYHKVKEIMDQNWLGKITHFEVQYNRNSNWRFPCPDPKMERAINWRMYREYCGGPLTELCAHQIDAVHFFTGSHPIKVTAIGGVDYWKDGRETYDNIRAIYEYPNGVKMSATSILSNAYNGYGIRVLGDKATLEIQRDKILIYAESTNNAKGIVDGVSGATLKAITQGEPVEVDYAPAGETVPEPTITALKEFMDSINTGKKPTSTVETAKDAAIAAHMANTAADTQSFQYWKPEYSV
ncbi:MAG TPA: Gfo/Idh/MocA family oxidoreductase [Cyclobacteriaceae bacterium]|nr:Gfo/Idh/MocA family oxidoreductase [Cyclobacteriaceae bacterium]